MLHELTISDGFNKDWVIQNASWKCIQNVKTLEAQKVFVHVTKHNVVSWGTFSCGFAQSILSLIKASKVCELYRFVEHFL